MSEGNFTRCFEHVDDNTESEIDEAITSAFDFVVQWLEEEDAKDVKAALERREVRVHQNCNTALVNFLSKIFHIHSPNMVTKDWGATDMTPKSE